jgi:hypothetical protein
MVDLRHNNSAKKANDMAAQLTWDLDGFPFEELTKLKAGTPFSHDVRQYLHGPKSRKAIIKLVNVNGADPTQSGWTAPGKDDFLKWDGVSTETLAGDFSLEAVP